MILLSCTNCCFNALQYDAIGTSVGYCTEHRVILNCASELTCGRHLRKDLSLDSARREHEVHRSQFPPGRVVLLRNKAQANGVYTSSGDGDLESLRRDPVANAVAEYGLLDTKIESLSQLRALPGTRAEISMLCLGRTYVRRCVERGGAWTSGLHLVMWTRRRLSEDPRIDVDDLRDEAALPLARRIDLAKWAVVMLRLIFVSDVATYAREAGDRFGRLADLAESAAAETRVPSTRKLTAWTRRVGEKRFDAVLPWNTYVRLSRELHRDQDERVSEA
jgi:hypothetical protein